MNMYPKITGRIYFLLGTQSGRGGRPVGENQDEDAPIRVLLADDHTMFRQGLAGVLTSYGAMEVVAEVPNDAHALRLARDLAPDVVVMQVQMPFERSMETLEAMRSFPNPPKVVICTMLESPRHVGTLAGAGASIISRSGRRPRRLRASDSRYMRGLIVTRTRNVRILLPRGTAGANPRTGTAQRTNGISRRLSTPAPGL